MTNSKGVTKLEQFLTNVANVQNSQCAKFGCACLAGSTPSDFASQVRMRPCDVDAGTDGSPRTLMQPT